MTIDALRQHSYQVFGACTLAQALERYRQAFHRAPELIVAHPHQAAMIALPPVQPADWCQCSATPGLGPWYLRPSRQELEERK